MLEFISPLALNHSHHLLTAAAHVWNERRQKSRTGNAKSVSLLLLCAIWKQLLSVGHLFWVTLSDANLFIYCFKIDLFHLWCNSLLDITNKLRCDYTVAVVVPRQWEEVISCRLLCQVIAAASEDQLVLIDMVSAIRLLSIDSLMQTVRQIIKQPPQQTAILSASKVSHYQQTQSILQFLRDFRILSLHQFGTKGGYN